MSGTASAWMRCEALSVAWRDVWDGADEVPARQSSKAELGAKDAW